MLTNDARSPRPRAHTNSPVLQASDDGSHRNAPWPEVAPPSQVPSASRYRYSSSSSAPSPFPSTRTSAESPLCWISRTRAYCGCHPPDRTTSSGERPPSIASVTSSIVCPSCRPVPSTSLLDRVTDFAAGPIRLGQGSVEVKCSVNCCCEGCFLGGQQVADLTAQRALRNGHDVVAADNADVFEAVCGS